MTTTTSDGAVQEAVQESVEFTHAGFWAVVAVIGHAPGVWMLGRLLAHKPAAPRAPRLGARTLRLNFVAISTTLVVTAAIAVGGHVLWSLVAFGIGHTLWSITLAVRILNRSVLQ